MAERDLFGGPSTTGTGIDTAGNPVSWRIDYAKCLLIVTLIAGGAAATADDVSVFGDGGCPFSLNAVESTAFVDVVAGGSTIQPRSASGGGGTALTGTVSTATAGPARELAGAYVARAGIAKGEQLYLRRSDRSITGTFVFSFVRVA